MADDKKYYPLGDPKNIRRVRITLYILCAIAIGADFLVDRHVDHPWEVLPGFYAFYGFVACVVLVLVAKEMRKLIMRGEDYYDD